MTPTLTPPATIPHGWIRVARIAHGRFRIGHWCLFRRRNVTSAVYRGGIIRDARRRQIRINDAWFGIGKFEIWVSP